jgi:hypothetical protein
MTFRVHGSVVEEETGRPLRGLLVRLYDKDVFADDFLGETRSGERGEFELRFEEAQFRDLFERRPDLYLLVYDARGGHVLHTTESEVRFDASRDERYEVRIPRERVRDS